ncbi:MAG: tetratricopeptide repeat protein [Planctomycetota bacterium]
MIDGSQWRYDGARSRAVVPRPATEATRVEDTRAPRFRSALERLSRASGSGPAASRIGEALRHDRADAGDVNALLARYGAAEDPDDLRGALERISRPIDPVGSPFELSSGREIAVRRPNGAKLDYAAGPIARLEDPRGLRSAAVRRESPAARSAVRVTEAETTGRSLRERLRLQRISAASSIAAADTSLGLSATAYGDDVYYSGSDFTYGCHVANWHHYHSCGHHWWGSNWSFGFSLCWPNYWYGLQPLWLHHPVYGYYPWYGGYSLGWCSNSHWWIGSCGPWSWGPYSYWYPYHDTYVVHETVVQTAEPQVVVVEQPAPQVVVVGQQGVPAEQPNEFVAPVDEDPLPALVPAPAPSSSAVGVAADRYLMLGDRAFRDSRYADAVHYYTKAVQLQPDVPVLHMLLSDALFATGDYAAAASALRSAIEGDPSLVGTVVDKRTFYSDERAFDRQLAVCELYLADHPADDDARLVLAVNLLFAGAPASAMDLLESDLAAGLAGDPVAARVLEIARERQFGESSSG